MATLDEYRARYQKSVNDPERFWAREAERLHWYKKWDRVLDWDFKEPRIKWFEGGKLNVSYNCLDRHVEAGYGDQTAIIWQGNNLEESRKITYGELLAQVSRTANALKSLGVKTGDRVCIYLQMIPELPIAMLACARIGAIHNVVFGAFSADSLRSRINDAGCKVLITQDTGLRGAKQDISMKANADKALEDAPTIEKVLVVKRTGAPMQMQGSRDLWWQELVDAASEQCVSEVMDAEDPLFILYTSGSTGKPKGILHTTGGYLLYVSLTHEMAFDYRPGDIFWCTADIGWITGHSYIVYGPLVNRATVLMFEGVPNFPDFGRFWQVVDKYRVNSFYTAPTALRALMKEGDSWPQKYDLSSLRVLGTVGEPIKSPEWHWYHNIIGSGRCPIVDTWWQTETGGHMITPLPGVTPLKPGSATLPFWGVQPVVLDDAGNVLEGEAAGNLAIKFPWPGMMRTIWGDPERFKQTYFAKFPGLYLTGDGCRRDKDGYYWITGRVDDMIIVSGHNLGTAEIEGAIGAHPAVAEAAVVGVPHEIKGNAVYAFVTLKTGIQPSDILKQEIVQTVHEKIGSHAAPDAMQFTDGLPKTRSGKIMRRILRAVATGSLEQIGDTSTLADPSAVEALITARMAYATQPA